MTLTIEAKAELLIRKPVVEVFNAFVDPDHISKFWFDKSTGPLCENASVEWHWSMYNFFVPVTVYEFKQNEKIVMTWGAGDDASTLDWTFTDRGDDGTLIWWSQPPRHTSSMASSLMSSQIAFRLFYTFIRCVRINQIRDLPTVAVPDQGKLIDTT